MTGFTCTSICRQRTERYRCVSVYICVRCLLFCRVLLALRDSYIDGLNVFVFFLWISNTLPAKSNAFNFIFGLVWLDPFG